MRQTHSWIPRPLYWFSESLLSNCSFDKLNWYQTNNVGVHLLVDICQVWSYLRLWSYLSRFHIQAIQLVLFFKKISVFVTFISPPNFLFLIVDGRPMYVELDLPVWYLLMISPPKMKSVHMFKRSTEFFFSHFHIQPIQLFGSDSKSRSHNVFLSFPLPSVQKKLKITH